MSTYQCIGYEPTNKPTGIFTIKFILGALYFLNQRPGIFIAPYLLVNGWRESRIGIVLFISGLIGLVVQTPAGQLTDEIKRKSLIIWITNALTTIGCLCLVYSSNFGIITAAVSATVISDAFSFPALYALTLGLVGPSGIVQQVPLNETFTHFGNASFAILCGILVAFTDGGMAIFWICVVMRAGSCFVISTINDRAIDPSRARGLETKSGEMASEPVSYTSLLTDYYVIVFLTAVLLFHFSNAAMLPLLSQQLFLDNTERGFEFAALAVITAQISMVASAICAGMLVPIFGTKPLFLTALAAIPIRGAIIVLLLSYHPDNYMLLATQILDGVAGGIFGVLLVLIAENLARGSGRFALLVGLGKTAEGVGAAFSNLVGEAAAESYGYRTAFAILSIAAVVPLLFYGALMPSARFTDGEAIDDLSISLSNKSTFGGSEHGSEDNSWTALGAKRNGNEGLLSGRNNSTDGSRNRQGTVTAVKTPLHRMDMEL